MGVPVSLVLFDQGLGLGVDGEDGLVLLVTDSVVDVASGCEVSVLKEFAECHGGVTLALVVFIYHILAMIFSAPRSCFSGKALRWPWMVTLLYCSMSSLYTPGGSVLGILSSGSLEGVAAVAGMPAVAGLVVTGLLLLLIALCVATSDALRASR